MKDLVVMLLLVYLPIFTSSRVLTVANSCTGLPNCHNLSYYLNDPSLYFTSHTVFTFIGGTHSLNQPIVVSGVTNLTLRGEGEIQNGYHWTIKQSTVMIKCTMSTDTTAGGLLFINSTVNIERITITNCGMPINYNDDLRTIFEPFFYGVYKNTYNLQVYLDLYASLLFTHSSNVSLYEVSIQNCSGFCVFSLNTDHMNLTSVYIAHTNPNIYNYSLNCCDGPSSDLRCIGGNLILFYLHLNTDTISSTPYALDIYNSSLSFGAGHFTDDVYATMSGLTLVDIALRPLYANLQSVVFFENIGGNMAGLTTEAIIGFNNITSVGANRNNCPGDVPLISFKISITNEVSFARSYINLFGRSRTLTVVFVKGSTFQGNVASDSAGMNLDTTLIIPFLPIESVYDVTITNSFFSQNRGAFGSCIGIGGTTPTSVATLVFKLINVIFDENKFDSTYLLYDARELVNPYKGVPPSCLAFGNTVNASFTNVIIANHETLGVYAYNTYMVLYKHNEIRNNTGVHGGGLMLLGSSAFILHSSNFSFINNKAQRGAAIFTSTPLVSSASFPFCQYQVNSNVTYTDSVLYFSGNRASITGDIIYGGDVNDCLLLTDTGVTDSSLHFDSLFKIVNETNSGYEISSDATRVCFCIDNNPVCNKTELVLNPVFPGQTVTVPIATVGENNGFTTGNVNIKYNGTRLGRPVPNDNPNCFNLTFPIDELATIGSNVSLELSIEDPFNGQLSYTRSLLIPIDYCPPGFTIITKETTACGCDESIAQLSDTVECSIEGETISHSSNIWIGYSETDSCVLIGNDCPFDYCLNTNVSFNVYRPNPQCALNRSGILCGGCADGLTLMLGSNKCGDCTNSSIALLLVFAVAGFALVILLIGLNLTVTVGTINGLIFYANTVKVDQAVFFPNGPIPFLSQFISWINLDLGIETCFYEGMKPSDKVWLQFIFPVYIWIIIGVIIIACRYSTKLSSLVGSNGVPVLATLVLLSYVKIIRTYILALTKVTLKCGLDNQLSVWAVNGNDSYFGSSHIWLFLFSIFVLIFTVIPYSFIVITIPIMERYSNSCGRFWAHYFKPISDAYCGPYKDKFRFWTGLLLIARLFIANTVPFLSQTSRVLLIIFVISFLIFFYCETGGPYRTWYLNLMELWFFVHLLFMSSLALADLSVIGTKISISLAFITFVCIITWHVIVRLREYKSFGGNIELFHNIKSFRHFSFSSKDAKKSEKNKHQKTPAVSVVTVDNADDDEYPRFRESLLQNEPYEEISISRSKY